MDSMYLDFYFLAKELGVSRQRIHRWCRKGLPPARSIEVHEEPLLNIKQGRVYLKRVNFGSKDPRTRREWINAFLSVVTPE